MKTKAGFTLIEVAISVGLFAIFSMAIYQTASVITKGIASSRDETSVASLADFYLEIARNLPYSQVGTLSGNPHGSLPDLPNAQTVSFGGATYRIYYAVTYIDDPADGTALAGTDPAPNDYKEVKLYVTNVTTGVVRSFLTSVTPLGLESMSSGGALAIKVFNAAGVPVPNATIHIVNTAVIPNINLTRTSDGSGNWVEVGLPDSVNGYHITATKNGYSTDGTYPIVGQNPNPVKPDATIANGQVTQVSFSIDQLSNLTFETENQLCAPLPSVGLEVRGAKLIGTPNVLKFDTTYNSDSGGSVPLSNIEWDSYTPALTGGSNMIYGSSPIQQVNLLPNTSQNFSLILGPKTANSLLVIVKDSATGNPIEGVTVELINSNLGVDTTKLTGGSILGEQDWSGGPGQATSTDPTAYFEDDGGVSGGGIPSGLRLAGSPGSYASAGTLTSSSFDTGTNATSYTTLTWKPTSQNASTTIKFQLAANNDGGAWNYIGPDGTNASYYTVSGTTISSSNNSSRYLRYRAYLSSIDPAYTPVLSNVTVNYVAGCFTPGQVMFAGLAANGNYSLIVSMTGYQTQSITPLEVGGYNTFTVSLAH